MQLKHLTGSCMGLFVWGLMAFPQVAPLNLSMEEFVRVALERNQDYLAAREHVIELQALVRQAGLRPTPTLEIETTTGAATGSPGESEYSVAYFHTVERADKRAKRVEIAERDVALAEAEMKERQRQIAFDVKDRFIAAVTEELKLSSVSSLISPAQENHRLMLRRVELGDAAPLEGQLLLVEMNRVQAQKVSLGAAAEAATAELKSAVGLPLTEEIQVIPAFRMGSGPIGVAELQQRALRERPDLQILQLLEQQALTEVDLARAEGRPNVTASARYTRSYSRLDELRDVDNTLTFGVSIPLFTRSRSQGSVAAAGSRREQQSMRREYLLRAIPREVEAAYRRWAGALRSLEIMRTGVIEPSQNNLTVIREALRLGELRLLDVVNEQRRLVELRLSFVEMQAEAARSLAELERAVGGNLP